MLVDEMTNRRNDVAPEVITHWFRFRNIFDWISVFGKLEGKVKDGRFGLDFGLEMKVESAFINVPLLGW